MPEAPVTSPAWTFAQHLLELAERAYLADQTGTKAAVPTNDADKDRLKRCFNLAYRSYCARNPGWTFMFQTVRVNFDPTGASESCFEGSASRYRLPDGVAGPPVGNWTYVDTSSPYQEIVCIDPNSLRRLRQTAGSAVGAPQYGAMTQEASGRPLPALPKCWVLTVTPAPGAVYSVEGRFRVPVVDLSADSDVTIAGPDHDIAIHRAALYEWSKSDMRLRPMLDVYKAEADEAFLEARKLDDAKRPRRLGVLRNTTSVVPTRSVREEGAIVTKFNGNPI